MSDLHRRYGKMPEEEKAKQARLAFEKEQRQGEAAALMACRHGGRVIHDWLGYRFVQVGASGVLFRRKYSPHGLDKETYDNGPTDPQRKTHGSWPQIGVARG